MVPFGKIYGWKQTWTRTNNSCILFGVCIWCIYDVLSNIARIYLCTFLPYNLDLERRFVNRMLDMLTIDQWEGVGVTTNPKTTKLQDLSQLFEFQHILWILEPRFCVKGKLLDSSLHEVSSDNIRLGRHCVELFVLEASLATCIFYYFFRLHPSSCFQFFLPWFFLT